jgi:acetyltransferase-like isoleucine patch superfamily enzyme
MKKPIMFLGSGQQITEFAEICDLNGQSVAGIIDSDYYGNTTDYQGIPYVGREDDFDFSDACDKYDFFIGSIAVAGMPRTIQRRRQFVDLVDQLNLPCANIIDPQCRISPRAKLGKGVYIGYSSWISHQVVIHDHCIMHSLAGLGHGCVIGKNTTFQRASTAGSNVTFGENVIALIGSRFLRIPSMSVGNNAIIYPGMVVMRDVAAEEIVKFSSRKIYSGLAEQVPTQET